MKHDKLWVMNDLPEEKIEKTAKEAGISKLLARIFLGRGVDDPGYIEEFLNPSLDTLHDPFLMCDMEKAVDRIIKAINNDEKILIYGDYDVDGVTSTSILFDFFRSLKADISYYIPDRLNEGYGISVGAVDRILEMDIDLMITVDCGITAFEEVKYITDNNLDIIITDHHECKESIPLAYAVINPLRPDCTYPFKELAGVGVAFKLVCAIAKRMGIHDVERRYLDLVTLGTVADVVPLLGENRAIVKHGLTMIENTSNIGLGALMKVSGAEDRKVTSFVISFVIAPRINAAGRIGDAQRAVKLLTTDHEAEAFEIAKDLDEQNKYRQETELSIWEEVVNIIDTGMDLKKEKVIVVSGEGWHHGIIGIVASKITERYNRPSILITIEDGMGKGSGRSIEGFNLFKALTHCEGILEKYGGHEQAAGLTLKSENIDELRRQINEYADSVLDECDLIPKVKIDVGLTREDISIDNARELELLAPFGANNPGPVLRYDNIKVSEIRAVGQDKHAKLKFNDNGLIIDAIGFNKGDLINVYGESDVLDIACSLEINSWNGNENVQLNIKDIRLGKDIIKENRFYLSLDRCIDFKIRQEDSAINEVLSKIGKIEPQSGIAETIDAFLSEGKKVAVLVNSLSGLKGIEEALGKIYLPARNRCRICYLSSEPHDIKTVSIIVNPYPGEASLSNFDRVILYGDWMLKDYLCEVVRGIDLDKVYVYNKIKFTFSEDDIILKRQDMVAVFQYLKSNYNREAVLEDLFAFAREIKKSYRIPMNYFKIKRIIEVFEELSLLKSSPCGKYGLNITMLDTGKNKTSLENSCLFRSIQSLKSS